MCRFRKTLKRHLKSPLVQKSFTSASILFPDRATPRAAEGPVDRASLIRSCSGRSASVIRIRPRLLLIQDCGSVRCLMLSRLPDHRYEGQNPAPEKTENIVVFASTRFLLFADFGLRASVENYCP